jgi:FMN phosphatase YigB (HAD superfamily)
MTQRPLEGVIVAFDIDNTLADPTGEAYRRTVTRAVSAMALGLDDEQAFALFEAARAHGHALERLGFSNPIHERGHPHGLATLCLMFCADGTTLKQLGIHQDDQPTYRAVMRRIAEVHRFTRHGPFAARLKVEVSLRRALRDRPEIERLRHEIERVAGHDLLRQWTDVYRRAELAQPVDDSNPMITALRSTGATPVIISEGRKEIQQAKLDRLGLSSFFEGRVLITENSAAVPGIRALDDAISRLIDAASEREWRSGEDELPFLWHYRCLMDAWAAKTPWFYGRCLHALRSDRDNAEASLCRPAFVPAQRWVEDPLRFVMVGDRYDSDVKPLVDLLGPECGLRIRLGMGKYAHLHPEQNLPADQRPDKTFTDWDSLANFLTDDLRVEDVKPITTAPDIAPRDEVRSDRIKRGLESPLEAVRLVATSLAAMT